MHALFEKIKNKTALCELMLVIHLCHFYGLGRSLGSKNDSRTPKDTLSFFLYQIYC